MVRYTGGQRWPCKKMNLGVFPSGQWGQTVNLLLFSFGGSNPPAPTKKSSVVIALDFCFTWNLESHPRGWIRTAAALSQKTAQKQPGGLFLAARLATSTRAHQKSSTHERALSFCFGRKFSYCEGAVPCIRPCASCLKIRRSLRKKEKSTQILNG